MKKIFFKSIFDEIHIHQSIDKREEIVSLPEETVQKIKIYFSLEKKPSHLSAYLKNKIMTSTNRARLSCRKLSESYFKDTGFIAGKTTVNKVLRKELGYHYLRTTIKTNFLNKDDGILYCFCFIKIITRALKLGFTPIFVDESKIELINNHSKIWRLKTEQIYYGNSSKQKRNLLLAVGTNKILKYEITEENTTAKVFLEFLNGLLEVLCQEKSERYLIILDNHSSHKKEEVIEFLKEKKIPVVFNAPYMSAFNAIELAFRAIKKIAYSNLYNSIDDVCRDAITLLNGEKFKNTLLYNYKETIGQYILFIDSHMEKNLNNLNLEF